MAQSASLAYHRAETVIVATGLVCHIINERDVVGSDVEDPVTARTGREPGGSGAGLLAQCLTPKGEL